MNPTIKNKLLYNVVKFEDLVKSQSNRDEIFFCFSDILSALLSKDNYQTILNPSTDRSKFDFLCVKNNPAERIGVSFQNSSLTLVPQVLERISVAYNYPYNRLIIANPNGFSSECYSLVNNIDPVNVELLNLDGIKNWVSRIEVESDLNLLPHEDIIKIVSKVFIERIVKDPSYLLNIEWREFEKTLAEIFEGLAFKVKLTPPSKDGGKDLILEMVKEGTAISYIVEVKHWRSMQKVGQNCIKDFLNVVCREKRESGIFLSTYGFTENAFEGLTELERTKVRFGSEEKIISLCKTYLKVKSGIWTPLQDLQDVLFDETF
ncbi:restriction endonuclease [Flavobacterium amniphilum]|uniref:restriction endonuclease n=1 Tax=Flavobacterium amniphilum TaxID=1834035 RepID=UPI00202A0AA3|nr:restriction endonuclease [Flavobacterium amniphilum]MCL9806655.1 restriction endonuclease [Flavobacterium amniphilum]